MDRPRTGPAVRTLPAGAVVLAILVIGIGANGCRGYSSTEPTQPKASGSARDTEQTSPVRITGVRNPMAIGDTEQLHALAFDANSVLRDVTSSAQWSVDDASVFTISAQGLLTAVGKGLTQIHATYAGATVTERAVVDQPGCTYLVSPAAVTFERGINSGTSKVTTQSGCQWSIASDADWLSVRPGTNAGVGTGTFTYTTTFLDGALDAPGRVGHAMVRWDTPTLGQNVLVTQTSACHAGFLDKPASFGPDGGLGNIIITTIDSIFPKPFGFNPWQLHNSASWVTVTSPPLDVWMPAAVDDNIHFTVAPNPDATPRTGVLTACNAVFTISQAGR